jgi:predicted nucleic acid-binding protein
VSRLILLDSEPSGLASNPRDSEKSLRCKAWLWNLLAAGDRVMIPAIIDYEVRRELLRAGKVKGVAKLDALLDALGRQLDLPPSGGRVLVEAAGLWAKARREGYPTADVKAIDVDVILAATAILAARDGFEVIVATGNVGHLGRFVDARIWNQIVP